MDRNLLPNGTASDVDSDVIRKVKFARVKVEGRAFLETFERKSFGSDRNLSSAVKSADESENGYSKPASCSAGGKWKRLLQHMDVKVENRLIKGSTGNLSSETGIPQGQDRQNPKFDDKLKLKADKFMKLLSPSEKKSHQMKVGEDTTEIELLQSPVMEQPRSHGMWKLLKQHVDDKVKSKWSQKETEFLEIKDTEEDSLEGNSALNGHQEIKTHPDSKIKAHFLSFIQPSDNKLTMKLFGSNFAVEKEKQRLKAANIFIIHPCSNFRLYWDLLMLLLLFLNLMVLPVSIAFFFDDVTQRWMVFNAICDVIFLVDILLNFRTGLIDKKSHGEIIMDGKMIAVKYIKGWFVVDVLSSLPIDYIFLAMEGEMYAASRAIKILRLTKMLQLLRLLRLSRLVRYVKILQEYFSLTTVVVRLFNLVIIMLMVAHWSGCIQYAVPVFQGWPEDSWVALERLQDADWWTCYTKSVFKAFSHMLGTGYGFYPPINVVDSWLTIASMAVGCLCYALVVGSAAALIQTFDRPATEYREHLQEVTEYMNFRKLSQDMKNKVLAYYSQRFGGKMFDEQQILSEVSDSLKMEIMLHNCKELILKVPFFIDADTRFVNDVINRLEYEMFQEGDIIITINSKNKKLYIIESGVVEVLNDKGSILARLVDGSYFGGSHFQLIGWNSHDIESQDLWT